MGSEVGVRGVKQWGYQTSMGVVGICRRSMLHLAEIGIFPCSGV